MKYFVHETAVIDSNTTIGENTKIWHFSHISTGASIGKRCVLGQNVFVGANVKIGDGVKIQNNVSVYNSVEIEDDVFCGPSMVFTNVNTPRAFIERKDSFAKTLVKKSATLGANCTIICGVTIGEYALIGVGAVITKDVKPYALMVGVPAKPVGWVSKAGEVLDSSLICPFDGSKYEEIDGNLVAA